MPLRLLAPALLVPGLLLGCESREHIELPPAASVSQEAERPSPVTLAPWTDVMVSVTDLDRTAQFFREIGGYETVDRAALPAADIAALGLPETASGEILVLRAPGSDHGYVRLVRFDNAGRKVPTRPGARAWDTGCYWSIMVRVKGMQAVYDEAIAMGWWTQTPITYLEFGESKLNVVVFQGPDGVQVQGYERLGQPLPEGFPDFDRLSQPFNLMQMVRDREAIRVLIEDVLGFDRFWLGPPYVDKAPTDMPLGIPRNLTTNVPYKAGIFYPEAMETGRLEAIEINGLEGHDYAQACRAPNLGILSVTFPVSDVHAARDTIRARGWQIETEPYETSRAPMGRVTVFAVRAPDGGLIEFAAPR